MGYSCPVCGDPQADEDHLANHLAFTAMIRGGDHEEFLDEHVPQWESLGEAELGETVSDLAEDEEYPQVFEDTTDTVRNHDPAHAHEDADGHLHEGAQGGTDEHAHESDGHAQGRTPAEELPPGADHLADANLDGAAADVLAEARELTQQRHEAAEQSAETDESEEEDS